MLIRPDVKELEKSIRKHALAAIGKYCEFLGIPKLDRPNKGRLVELIEEAILDAMHERDDRHKQTQRVDESIAMEVTPHPDGSGVSVKNITLQTQMVTEGDGK